MSSAFIGLAWLPPPPDDFRQRCLAVTKAEQGIGRAIIQLASHALSDSQLRQLAKTISGLRARGADLAPMTPFRLGILGNGTLDLLLPALVGSAAALRHCAGVLRAGLRTGAATRHHGGLGSA